MRVITQNDSLLHSANPMIGRMNGRAFVWVKPGYGVQEVNS
jgi:hypothetical protein